MRFKVGDLVLIKIAHVTPALIGQKRRVVRATEFNVYLDDSHSHWSNEEDNGLELIEPSLVEDRRDYLEAVAGGLG